MCAQVTYSLAKRKEQAIHIPVAPPPPASQSWNPADSPAAPVFDDDVIASEDELRAWAELDRPETPSLSTTSRPARLPKRYQGVFQERYILMILVLIILLFIAATFQTDRKTELEKIKRMYHVDESVQPLPRSKK
jgi:hypothetical protein